MKKSKIKTILIIILILLILFGNIRLPFRKNLEIHFLDVGQGDSCLIRTINNKTILIDGGDGGGDYDYGEKVLKPYLLDHGITKIDFIIISHFDSDHVGGLLTLMNELKVGRVIISKQSKITDNYERFKNIVKEKHIKALIVEKGDTFKLDEDLYIDILWPNSKNFILENPLNNNSIVFKLCYKDFSMIFTGDIEELAETELVKEYQNTNKLRADVLKVAHHRV